jgi:hypothetical protein
MKKYQFYISFDDKKNTASTKAIADCTQILSAHGYENHNIAGDISSKWYLLKLVIALMKLIFKVKQNSIVAIQYPLLSGNRWFKYVMRLLKLKNIRFFCIIHDLDELRYPHLQNGQQSTEVKLLNYYDVVIVHNEQMRNWLKSRGLVTTTLCLYIFDYLSNKLLVHKTILDNSIENSIVFAGNLIKSPFIYQLNQVSSFVFNLYGPNFDPTKAHSSGNVDWKGAFDPEEILAQMDGAFGLIWDGEAIDELDDVFGNYLKYNNPHKLSLYLAAGLPVIAPKQAAVAQFITDHQVGLLINNLKQLQHLEISSKQYNQFKQNAQEIANKLRQGNFFHSAILRTEQLLISPSQLTN